jgi:serine/threonine protein kinase
MKLPDNYKFVKKLGEGTCGTVIHAIDLISKTHVAIKIQTKNAVNIDFEEEINNLNKIKDFCNGFVCIKDSGYINGRLYIVMNLINGKNLTNWAKKKKRHQLIGIFNQLIHLTNTLHKHGIAHLDIKPDNVMVDSKGTVFLVDLGLMCFKKRCSDNGSPFFMPEDIGNSLKDRMVGDIYAIGLSLVLLLDRKMAIDISSGSEKFVCPWERQICDIVNFAIADNKEKTFIKYVKNLGDIKKPKVIATIHKDINVNAIDNPVVKVMMQRNKRVVKAKAIRKAPKDRAKEYPLNHIKTGNDGKKHIVVVNKNNVKRWKKI